MKILSRLAKDFGRARKRLGSGRIPSTTRRISPPPADPPTTPRIFRTARGSPHCPADPPTAWRIPAPPGGSPHCPADPRTARPKMIMMDVMKVPEYAVNVTYIPTAAGAWSSIAYILSYMSSVASQPEIVIFGWSCGLSQSRIVMSLGRGRETQPTVGELNPTCRKIALPSPGVRAVL